MKTVIIIVWLTILTFFVGFNTKHINENLDRINYNLESMNTLSSVVITNQEAVIYILEEIK